MATRALFLFLTILVFSTSFALCYQLDLDFDNERDPERRLQQCRRQCEQQGQQQRMQCERRCEQQFQREQRESTGREAGGNTGDPEQRLQQCRQRCQQQRQGQQQRMQCERRCEQQYQQERREQGESTEGNSDPAWQKYQECKQRCGRQRQDEQQRRQCVSRCEAQYEEERREHRRHGNDHTRREREEEGEQSEENNPFHFSRRSFRDVVTSEHGRVSVLQNFLEKSKLFLGIANYRIAIVEAQPRAFFTPHHLDADSIYFVARGWGSITHMCQNSKETNNLQPGDILTVPAGCLVYMVNKGNNEKLILVKLINPVSTPGHFEVFHATGGRHESIMPSFSDEILEAAYNVRGERLERVFGRQKQGHIVRASEEQVRSLSRHTTEGGHQWPFGESQSKGTFNLLKKRPFHSSRRGQLHEADGNDYEPLKRFDVQISYANLSQGSMIAPAYNTRAFKIAVILQGEGYIETVCPHLSRERTEQGGEREQEREQERRRHSWEKEGQEEQEQQRRRGQEEEEEGEEQRRHRPSREEGREGEQQRGRGGQGEEEKGRRQRYQNVRSWATTGTVVLIPPGHPSAVVASGSQNLEAVCFEINSERNQRNFLAGRDNILSKMDKEAKELAFGMPAREVDEVLQEQKEQVIVAGPKEREHGRRPLLPLLDIAAAFM